MGSDGQPLEDRIDALFRLPAGEFIGARNALAAELRKGKDAEGAQRVKALAKPSVSAWAVNQLYWTRRDDFDRLLEAGARVRADQQRGLQGGKVTGLPAATRERRDVLAGLMEHASRLLAGDGAAAAPAMLKRVETTLAAIADMGGAGPDAALGRLVRDLEPPGFDALLALAAAAPIAAPPPLPPSLSATRPKQERPTDPASDSPAPVPVDAVEPVAQAEPVRPSAEDLKATREAQARARATVLAAVEQLEQARLAAGEAEAARAAAAARSRQTIAEVERAKQQLEQARKHADRADVTLKRAETRKQTADEALASAEKALAEARAAAHP